MDIISFILGLFGALLSAIASFVPYVGFRGWGFLFGIVAFIFALVIPKGSRNQLSLAGFFHELDGLSGFSNPVTPIRTAFLADLGCCCWCILGIYGKTDAREKKKEQKEKKAELAANGILAQAVMPCLDGLPVPEGTPVQIYDCVDGLRFQKNNREWSIQNDQITGIDISEGRTLSRGVSAGRVVGGWILAGGVGATLSSMPKSATALVVTYLSQSKE